MKKKLLFINALCLVYFASTFAQTTFIKKWDVALNKNKAIVENKGQYSDLNGKKILFTNFDNGEKFYFTNKGLIIKIDTLLYKKPLAVKIKDLFENEHEQQKKYLKESAYYLCAEWQNTNPNAEIIASEKTQGDYIFGMQKEICNGYNKITYKNIYNNIDIEYTVPSDSTGLKYNIILHPGADISDVSLKYSGDVNEMLQDNNGNIIIKTSLHSITEHSPNSFTANDNKSIASASILKDNTITFFVDNKSPDKTIIIDPWISGSGLSGDDWGYDVDYDLTNNLYVYIHDYTSSDWYVRKYSPTGVLLFTHVTSAAISTYEGNFIVDRLTNRIYIGDGYNGSGAFVYRINSNGVSDGFSSQQSTALEEIWDFIIDNNLNRIICLGGGTTGNVNGGIINTATGVISPANFTGLGGAGQDISCNTVDSQGNLFVVYANSSFGSNGHLISLVNSNLNGNVWQLPHGMYGFDELLNHCPDSTCTYHSNAFNGLYANNDYLYYYDGQGLAAFNKTNGTRIAAVSVSWSGQLYTPRTQGGIAVDDCNNIYIGGPNSNILIYNFDGTAFNQLGNMPLGWSGNQSVLDIKYEKSSNLLYISGHSNVGVFDAPIICITNINENLVENENIKFYPNPAHDFTTLKTNTTGKYNIKIIDATGKLVKYIENLNSNEEKINISELEKGIYFVKIIDDKGEELSLVKLIVN